MTSPHSQEESNSEGVNNLTTTLEHKDRTIQDIYDDLTSDKQVLVDLIIGAAVEDEDLSDVDDVVEQYDDLSEEVKAFIDFIVGASEHVKSGLNHTTLPNGESVSDFLQHHGVKGMKWGVRNKRAPGQARLSQKAFNSSLNRREARDLVKGGSANLATAHLAAMKSTGHRVANAVLGDKTYWKGMAITAGVSAAALGGVAVAVSTLPASSLIAIAGAVGVTTTSSTTAAGVSAAAGAQLVSIGAGISQLGLTATNLGRAVRGNTRIDKSYASLAREACNRQNSGSKKVQKVLRKSGGLRRRDLKNPKAPKAAKVETTSKTRKQSREMKQSMTVGEFLSHHVDTPLDKIM